MNKLIEKSKKVLEFDKIINLLKDEIESDLARQIAEEEEISINIVEINKRLDQCDEAIKIMVDKSEPPLFGIHDIRDLIKRLNIGGVLNPSELLKISDFLRVSRYLKSYLSVDLDEYEYLPKMAENLFTNKKIEDRINDVIISEDEISNNASAKLSSIRQQIASKKIAIKDKLNSIITDEQSRKHMQDSLVTMREGRYVVPVKLESKSKVKGIVHDRSSSGQTVYIEPMAVVNLNNDLRELYSDEREEINRILQELSQMVAERGYEIFENQDILAMIDFIFAKAKLSLKLNAARPKINGKRYINLKEARHPLLDPKKVVPIDIYIGDEFTSLIITGPNTGGKTVSLKTVGLFVLMAQYGLHIPAREGSEVGIFDNVLADIGDEQSIEQSLSTFSSHMINIVEILKFASSRSLVIFDELGAGTDPTEGAALANAIMEHMRRNNIISIATTHYNQLKIYALTTDRVANASMEFNVDTLSPTYKLLIGIPGKSNAFEISKRLGLEQGIIDDASKFISDESVDFENVLKSIEKDRSIIENEKIQLKNQIDEYKKKNESLEKELNIQKNKRDQLIEDSKTEAKQILLNAKENVRLMMDQIKEVKEELSSEQARKVQEINDTLRNSLEETIPGSQTIKIKKAKEPVRDLKVGDSVRSDSLNADGTVIDIDKNGKDVLVQIGMMKVKLPKNSLSKSDAQEEKQKSKTKKLISSKSKYVKSEIDIRAKTFDEAEPIIEKYIDDAYLAGLKSVRIIHGKGSGALREKVKNYLKTKPNIKSYKDAAYNQGGSGVTVVEFK